MLSQDPFLGIRLFRPLFVFLCPTVGIVKGLAVAVKPARLTVEARFNLARLLAVFGGFQMVVPFRPRSALDLTDLAELIIFQFARVRAMLEGHTVGFKFRFVLAEDLTLGAVVFASTVFYAL